MQTGVYCHIPFCKRRCAYCDFYVEIRPREAWERTVGALLREAEGAAPDLPTGTCGSLYIGGGTPSLLGPELAGRLVHGLLERLPFAADAEISMEANPESLDRPLLDAVLRAGVNRLSLGIQSLDDPSLALLGRLHDARRAREAVRIARESGLRNLSCDLIYGLPARRGEEAVRETAWLRSLEETIALAPEHVSCYLLTLEGHLPLARAIEAGDPRLPGDREARRAYESACLTLERSGYRQYEISNWCLPGFECGHNVNVWLGGYYLGLGPGAHGHLPGRRTANRSDLDGYLEALERGATPPRDETPTDASSRREELVMLGMRLTRGVAWADIAACVASDRLGNLRERIAPLASAGLIEDDGERLKLGREGLFVSNAVVAEILAAVE